MGPLNPKSLFTLAALIAPPLFCPSRANSETLRAVPDAGVSDEYLVRLGSAAESYLLAQLDDSRNEPYFDGIVFRLGIWGDLDRPNRAITARLKSFVESHRACKGVITDSRFFAIGTALTAIGQRGDESEVSYLARWAVGNDFTSKMQCNYSDGSMKQTLLYFRESALLGLGRNPSKAALGRLLAIKRSPPKTDFPGSYMGALNQALSDRERIQSDGIESFLGIQASQIRSLMKAAPPK
jgi:hypothetical protein